MYILIVDPEFGGSDIRQIEAEGHTIFRYEGEITLARLGRKIGEIHPDVLYLNLALIPKECDIKRLLSQYCIPRWFLYTGEASWKESGGWGFTAEELEERLFVPAAEG